MTFSRTVLDEAHFYAARGWRVVPILPGQKRPALDAWVERATTDHVLIDDWWKAHPDHGVGIVTGEASGLFVLDIDPEHGGDDTLADLEHTHGPLPDTIETITGSGGRHILFAWPGWNPGTNAGQLGPGLDLRAEGGQIVAPPTIHPNGRPYQWELEHDPHDGLAIAAAPDWLLDLLRAPAPAEPRRDLAPYTGEPRPGDRFAATCTWPELLERDGAQCVARRTDHKTGQGYELWTRPGKNARDGASASLYYGGTDVLKVFTTNWPGLTEGQTYNRFAYLTATRYHGDFKAAARALSGVDGGRDKVAAWIASLPDIDDVAASPAPPVVDEDGVELSRADRIRSRLYTYSTLEQLPPPAWLIDGWLMDDTLALLHGPPGHGKSFVAVDWACTIAAGIEWHGNAGLSGPVLYVLAEGTRGVRQRLAAWSAANGRPVPEDVIVHPYAIDIADPSWSGALAEVAAEREARLVIVDTLARNMLTGDENATKDMGIFISGLDRIREATNSCVATVHHQARAGNIRGAIALEAAMDTIIQCTQDGTTLTLKMGPPAGKQKDAEPAEDFRLTREVIGMSCALVPWRPGVDISPTMREMLATLGVLDLSNNGVPVSVWQRETNPSKATFYRHLQELLDRGFCLKLGTETRPLYTLTDQGRYLANFTAGTNGLNESHAVSQDMKPNGLMVSPPLRGGGGETNETDQIGRPNETTSSITSEELI